MFTLCNNRAELVFRAPELFCIWKQLTIKILVCEVSHLTSRSLYIQQSYRTSTLINIVGSICTAVKARLADISILWKGLVFISNSLKNAGWKWTGFVAHFKETPCKLMWTAEQTVLYLCTVFAVFSGRFDQPKRHRSHPSLCATAGSEERQYAILQSGMLCCATFSQWQECENVSSNAAYERKDCAFFNLSQSHIYYLLRGLAEVLTSPHQH